jgi:hypothetical protein
MQLERLQLACAVQERKATSIDELYDAVEQSQEAQKTLLAVQPAFREQLPAPLTPKTTKAGKPRAQVLAKRPSASGGGSTLSPPQEAPSPHPCSIYGDVPLGAQQQPPARSARTLWNLRSS